MKKVLSILLIVTSLFALVGCGGKTENLQKEVDALKQSLAELQATVSSQNQTITDQTGKLAELEAAKAAQAETIAALQNSANLSAEEIAALEAQLAEKEEKIAELEQELSPKGEICSLEKAYEKGKLTKENLEEIAEIYNATREIKSGDAGYLAIKNLLRGENVDKITAQAIKNAYAELKNKQYSETAQSDPFKAENVTITTYYGTWNNCVLFVASIEGFIEDAWPQEKTEIGGVEFLYFRGIYVWFSVEG